MSKDIDDQLWEHPGTGVPTEGVELPADGVMRELEVAGDDPLAAAEADNYRRANEGHIAPDSTNPKAE